MTFWSCRKNNLIRKTRLIQNLYNVTAWFRTRGNEIGLLIKYNERNIFLQKPCKKWGRETSFRPLFVFKKALYEAKTKGQQLSFYIWIAFNLEYNKNKLYKTLDYSSRDMLNFNFLEKGLGIVSPPNFVHDFSRKMFLMLYFINWLNLIVRSPLLEILDNMCSTIVCFPSCDIINFEINLIFLIKPFLCMAKKSRQKFKCLENE